MAPKAGGSSGGKVANRLVALSSAAVLAVYSAGYLRTRSAAERLLAAERPRVVIPEFAPAASPASSRRGLQSPLPRRQRRPRRPHHQALRRSRPAPARSPKPAAKAAIGRRHDAGTVTRAGETPSAATPTPTPAPIAEPSPTPSPAPQWKDGTFSGWGTSRHGDIEATVVIEAGRIVNAYISQCWTRYSCSWVAHLQGQVVSRQSPEVDYVSGATQSTNAFYYAVVQALSKAK